jgi:hypothetical protein
VKHRLDAIEHHLRRFYVDSSVVFLASEDGKPLSDANGSPLSLPLEEGVDPRSLACVLLRQRVRSNSTNGFERGALPYPKLGWM